MTFINNTKCKYCHEKFDGKFLKVVSFGFYAHEYCETQMEDRMDNQECVCCKNPRPKGRNYFCERCKPGSEYKYYIVP